MKQEEIAFLAKPQKASDYTDKRWQTKNKTFKL